MYLRKVNNNKAIGIFDSGIGGLTVAKAIREHLPQESLIYFGDTKHLPYGEKSADAVKEFSISISNFLKEKQCKMIVIACNTASSLAYEAVKKNCPGVQIVNVIEPVVNRLSEEYSTSTIGIIGTKGTIKSGIYLKKIKERLNQVEVNSLATPLLAVIIEEGFIHNSISRAIIENYLKSDSLKNIQQLILACTHYPLIQDEINDFYKGKVNIIDSASEVALHIKSVLLELNLMSTTKTEDCFYVSDFTKSFEKSAKFFFGKDIHLQQVKLNP